MENLFSLLRSFSLPEFPSGSSINFYDERLFLVGDDAHSIWILDTMYNKVDTIQLFDSTEKKNSQERKG